ncbi:hypothetical protein [Desulfitibacter alkalitolerans]|uniref:hypothetical protein n=1 Tax=Desulfitibacter alkalitolerans TaxID=264641 RepID=UPI0012EBC8CA|nr:hypothetical protein [Desulfitibacter alkalitolerans]
MWAPNHLKLLWSKAMVVSVKEKAKLRLCQVRIMEMSTSESPFKCRNMEKKSSKLGSNRHSRISIEET